MSERINYHNPRIAEMLKRPDVRNFETRGEYNEALGRWQLGYEAIVAT
jgi:hypothetical protein